MSIQSQYSLLSVFAIINKGDTVTVFREIGVFVTAYFEPEVLALYTVLCIDVLGIIPTSVSMSRSG